MVKGRVIIFVRVYFRVGPTSVAWHCGSGPGSDLSEVVPLTSSPPPDLASSMRCMLRLRIRNYRRQLFRCHLSRHHPSG